MTNDELLAKMEASEANMCDSIAFDGGLCKPVHEVYKALRAVVELHKQIPTKQTSLDQELSRDMCAGCNIGVEPENWNYNPCPTIQAIEKELE